VIRAAAPPQDIAAAYRARASRRLAGLGLLALGLAAAALLDMATGPAFLSPGAVARSVLRLVEDQRIDAIVWSIRMPVAALAALVGAALGLTGAIMQTILANPLASSYTLGVSAGAGFGASLVIVFGAVLPIPEAYAVPGAAFLFSGLACAGVYAVGATRGATPERLALAGVAMLFLFQALLSLRQFVASPEALQQIVFWLFGSLQRATWAKAGLVALALAAAAPILAFDAWRLTALKLGDDRAASLGAEPKRLRLRALALVSALTGVAVAFVGAIGFVGLVAPHVARMIFGEDQRYLLMGSALVGAVTLSSASVLSKSIVPGALFPIGIVTAMIGVPFFLWLILSFKRSFW
jgi:iron complex transport system permease protein